MIGSILVPVGEPGSSQNAVQTAFLVARQFQAHVEGLHVRPSIMKNLPYVSEATATRTGQVMSRAREQEVQAERHAEHLFERVRREAGVESLDAPPADNRPSASWTVETGIEESVIAERGRVFDVIVVAQSLRNSEGDSRTILEAALLGTARPVLLVPRNWSSNLGSSVLVAWNRSPLSARAVLAALPFLRQASSVSILHAATGAKEGPSAEDLARYFAWQKIPASVREVAPHGQSVGEVILSEADSAGADLIVMGARSQSRLSEIIFGGVTSYVTTHADLPVLMAH